MNKVCEIRCTLSLSHKAWDVPLIQTVLNRDYSRGYYILEAQGS